MPTPKIFYATSNNICRYTGIQKGDNLLVDCLWDHEPTEYDIDEFNTFMSQQYPGAITSSKEYPPGTTDKRVEEAIKFLETGETPCQ